MFHEVRMQGEVIVFAMFKDKHTLLFQESFLEDEVWYRRQFLQGVGGIGKDEVILLLARLDISEHISTQGDASSGIQFFQTVLYETVVISVEFHANHLTASSGEQFEGDAACTREKVEGGGVFKVDITCQHVEDVLFGKIRRGPRLESAWNVKMPSLVFPCDNPHLPLVMSVIRSKGILLNCVAGARLNSAVGLML